MGNGEWAALTAAFLWTISSLFWNSVRLSAWHLNLIKCVLGSILVGLNLLFVAWHWSQAPLIAPLNAWGWLGLSSLVGIVAGDTLYFRCLQILGPQKALMIAATSPLFAVISGWLWLRETILLAGLIGVVCSVAGILIVIRDRKSIAEGTQLMPGNYWQGILAGLLGSICNAIGLVFSKLGMIQNGTEVCGYLEATWIRLFLSALIMLGIMVAQRQLVDTWRKICAQRAWWRLLAGTVLGTWLGIGASMLACREANSVAVAQTLMATCPLFAIPVYWIVYGQRSTWVSVAGTLLAIFGIWLVLNK